MKKSELKRIIREERGLPQPPVKVAPEKDPKGGRRKVGFVKNEPPTVGQELDEVMVGGEMVDPNVVSAIMAAVPTLVAVGAAINWKEEIAAWLKSLASKDDDVEDMVMKDQ